MDIIQSKAGVKQGCPLSSIFNLEQEVNLGIGINGKQIAVMSFAVDTVLLSKEASDMEMLLSKCLTFDEKLVTVNRKTRASVRALPVKNKKLMKIFARPHRWWGDQAIASMAHENLAKYLAVFITPQGVVELAKTKLLDQLDNLKKSLLQLMQKLHVLKTTFLPQISHQLRLSIIKVIE